MTEIKNRRVVLASRPQGAPGAENFRIEDVALPALNDGEILLQTLFLSLDPYMRGRMDDGHSYAAPVAVDDVMEGGTVAKVVESRNKDFAAGDVVLSYSGWQTYAISNGAGLRKLNPALAPVSTALGVLGMPGFTAWAGLQNIGQPKADETVVVAAAAGPVGSAVGQIAKLRGARAVGIAGGAAKCAYLVNDLKFDVAIDHRAPDFAEQLKAACPKGIDVYFENVGGAVLEAVAPLLNDFARVPVCGLISQYNGASARQPLTMRSILVQRLRVQGFIVSDFAAQYMDFLGEMSGWLKAGQVKYREDIAEGIDAAPEAFMGMLQGRNFGKQLVRVSAG